MTTWIDVKDKLPEDCKEVLYFAVTNNGMSYEIMTGHLEKGSWKHCCMFYSSMTLNHLVEVTHWMELPEYPERAIMPHRELREAMDFYNE